MQNLIDIATAIKIHGELKLTVTEEGLYLSPSYWDCFLRVIEEYEEDGKQNILDIDLLDGAICDDWEFVRNTEIGALVGDEMIILARNTDRDEDGNLLDKGDCYFDANYAYSFLWERILRDGYAFLEKLN